MPQPIFRKTRVLLLAGFGGLLLLMAFAGLDALRVLGIIQNRNNAIRADFLARNRLLNQIRSDLYVSGTFVRDYLLEPDPAKAESHRAGLERARREMESALNTYARNLNASERTPFQNLQNELTAYWRALQPVMLWTAKDRKARGYEFLRDQVYPRRTAMLGLADEIGRLNESQLNAGSLQVAALFWDVRLRLSLTLLVTFGIGVVLAGFSIARILQLERESKELSARLVEVQESERRAISRELHDEVGQSLSALVVGLGNLGAIVTSADASAVTGQILELRRLAESSVGVVRNMALLLRPSMLDDLGLVPALQWQAREVSKRSGMAVNLTAEDVADELPDEYKTAIYRVVQEALHNCEKHSQAKSVDVALSQEHSALRLSIRDDGRGFGPQAGRGLGLRGMEERIDSLNGIFHIESALGRGTSIAIRLPLAPGRLSSRNRDERH